jgi:hypothetical protein
MHTKLLENYIRYTLLLENTDDSDDVEYSEVEDDSPVQSSYTYKELFDFLRYVYTGRKAKSALRFIASVSGSSTVEGLLGLGAGVASAVSEEAAGEAASKFLKKLKVLDAKSPIAVLKKFYGMNGSGGIEGIAIPENISALIDDKVETAFIKHLLGLIKIKAERSPDETVSSTFIVEKLKEFTLDYEKTKGAFVDTQ